MVHHSSKIKRTRLKAAIAVGFVTFIFFFSGSCTRTPVSQPTPAERSASEGQTRIKISELCDGLKKEIAELKWKLDPCQDVQWKTGGLSVQGRPLLYAEFGNPQAKNTTLIFTAVHGDEITPLFIGLQLVQWMKIHSAEFKNDRVIVAPLVNPDGFFRHPRIRMNAKGVDVNRNFLTADWNLHALKAWKSKFRSDPRRFPGAQARSEPETIFQEELILSVRPQKILSVHAPLNFMDYDGPTVLSLAKFPKEYVQECLKLRRRLKAVPGGFFPGSLGNYAGQELGIPTLTLELPSADPKMAEKYWKRFQSGIKTMIEFAMPDYAS